MFNILLERIAVLKLHLSRFVGQNAFSGYGDDHVLINGQRHTRSLVVLPEALRDWSPATLDGHTFEELMDLPVEILLLGTGRRKKGIGLEVMDTPAACRTYNILLSEDRKVGAAIFLDTRAPPAP